MSPELPFTFKKGTTHDNKPTFYKWFPHPTHKPTFDSKVTEKKRGGSNKTVRNSHLPDRDVPSGNKHHPGLAQHAPLLQQAVRGAAVVRETSLAAHGACAVTTQPSVTNHMSRSACVPTGGQWHSSVRDATRRVQGQGEKAGNQRWQAKIMRALYPPHTSGRDEKKGRTRCVGLKTWVRDCMCIVRKKNRVK